MNVEHATGVPAVSRKRSSCEERDETALFALGVSIVRGVFESVVLSVTRDRDGFPTGSRARIRISTLYDGIDSINLAVLLSGESRGSNRRSFKAGNLIIGNINEKYAPAHLSLSICLSIFVHAIFCIQQLE